MPLESELTDRQREIFVAIYESARDKGFQPSIRELCDLTGIRSTNGIVGHLNGLERKGWIDNGGMGSRCIRMMRNLDGTPFDGFAAK